MRILNDLGQGFPNKFETLAGAIMQELRDFVLLQYPERVFLLKTRLYFGR
jgi:hypothetical protein